MGDFQAVVGDWPSSLSWEPAPTWAFGLSKCILRKNRRQVLDHCPGFSSSATKPDPCTGNAAGTGRVRHTGLGSTRSHRFFGVPVPLPLAAGPDTPWIRAVGPLPGAFPFALGVRTASRPGGGRSGRKYDFARGWASIVLGPDSRLRTLPGQMDIPDASLQKRRHPATKGHCPLKNQI